MMGNWARHRKLSRREKHQLVEKLLACPSIRDRNIRDRVVQELDFITSTPRNPNMPDQVDVMDILNRCLDFPGGLQQLIEEIEFHEKYLDQTSGESVYSLQMQNLNNFVEFLVSLPTVPGVSHDLLIELYKITHTIKIEEEGLKELETFHSRKVRDFNIPSPRYNKTDKDKTLIQMIQDLAKLGKQSMSSSSNEFTHPLLPFIGLLSKKVIDPAVSRLLLRWQEEVSKNEDLRIIDESSEEAPHHLLVTFKPRDEKGEVFDIQAWLTYKQNEVTMYPDKFLKEAVPLKEIPLLLNEWIGICQRHPDPLIIELFLPHILLTCNKTNVHKWKIDNGYTAPIAICQKYPLVLRSYDRTYTIPKDINKKFGEWQAWKEHWNKKVNKSAMTSFSQPLKEKEACQENVTAWLQTVACVTMLFAPLPYDKTQTHIFMKMLTAGTSVALWPRASYKDWTENVIEQAYHNILLGVYHGSMLPQRILERRQKDALDENALINHLTLFWDDPARLPPGAPPNKYMLAFPI